MLSPQEIYALGNVSVVAPAGYGKTQIIAQIAGLGRRTLILTHTHAGVHAIKERLKRLSVPASAVSVDTVAGWSMRYSHAFPKVARPPEDMPSSGQEWDQLYTGARNALNVSAIKEVILSSYDRILIDEYQDCPPLQHNLAIELSKIVPTTIFGDPMQGVFEFAGANLSWEEEIYNHFPLATELEIPHRWAETNPDLGEWIAEVREKLIAGEQIDLQDPRINFRLADDAFDMSFLFESIDGKEGGIAGIHCARGICNKLAKATRGRYQAIEEIASIRLHQFASEWDSAVDGESRRKAVSDLLAECFHKRALTEGEEKSPEEVAVTTEMLALATAFDSEDCFESAKTLLSLCRNHPRWRLYRSGLWRDAERSVQELTLGRHESMIEAAGEIRLRMSHTGRKLPVRTASTPLLLKGLEFDHVVIPDASHFVKQSSAQAKQFYVAISRATHSLSISLEGYVQTKHYNHNHYSHFNGIEASSKENSPC